MHVGLAAALAGYLASINLPAHAANFDVANEAQLTSAINSAAPSDTITFTGSITLTANLPNITKNVTINGGNFTLSGNNQYRGLFVESGAVAISNLTIANAKAQGGHGGAGAGQRGTFGGPGGSGGGGGAGMGGALFIATGANVTVKDVALRDGAAIGGNGGASEENRCCAASGGGGGYWSWAPNGFPGGASESGSGGNGNGGDGKSHNTGSSGGFGGGGGGGWGNVNEAGGGNGGFGGGGGGGSRLSYGGSGGFLGANGGQGARDGKEGANGGSGAGMGGAIFVQEGGTLSLAGSLTISGNKVSGGSGNVDGAAGSGIFLHGNGQLQFTPASGQTQTISDAIVDPTGVGATGVNAGSWALVKSGDGTTILTGANAYSGGTTVNAGLLRFATDSSLGSAGKAITLNGGSIGTTVDTPANASTNRSLTLAASGAIDVVKNPFIWSGLISGQGQLNKTGAGELSLTGANTYSGGTLVSAGVLRFAVDTNLGAAGTGIRLNGGSIGTTADAPATSMSRDIALLGSGGIDVVKNALTWSGNISGNGQLIKSGSGELALTGTNTYTGGTLVTGGILRVTSEDKLGAAGTGITLNGGSIGTTKDTPAATSMSRNITLTGSGGGIDVALHPISWSGTISGDGKFIKSGDGELWLTGTTNYTGGTLVERGTLRIDSDDKLGAAGSGVTLNDNGGLRASNSFLSNRNFQLDGAGGVLLVDEGKTLSLAGSVKGRTLTKVGAGTLRLSSADNFFSRLTNNGGTVIGSAESLRSVATLLGGIVFDSNPNNTIARSVVFEQADADGTFTGAISGLGSINKTGSHSLILSGRNTYSGGTGVLAGTLEGTTKSLQGNILNNATVIFNAEGFDTYAGNMSGSGALIVKGSTLNLSGTNNLGTLTNFGTLNINGTTSVAQGTTAEQGFLIVNGKLISDVTVNKNGTLRGTGNIIGNINDNGGTIMPGNSIGHLVVDGDFTSTKGILAIEINAKGESDRISVIGAGHTVNINAGLLQILPEAGTYAPNTKYTIITTEAGGAVWLGEVAGGVGFLTPEVSIDGGVISVSLILPSNAFRAAAQTTNQGAVGRALDTIAASGSLGGLVTAMANVPISQGAAALQALSGQPYADFGTVNMRSSQLFMNAVGRQMAVERGAGLGGAKSVALAETCTVVCDASTGTPSRFGAWLSGVGSTGSVLGDGNAAGVTYTLGGTAFGIDYRLDPRFVAGIAGGYVGGTQWVNGFSGNGNIDALSVALYGSYTDGGFYTDALAGYATASNRMQRVVSIPGTATGIANGDTSANQFLGQIEAGYKIGFGIPASPSITPFGRLQAGSSTQAGFTESGQNVFALAVQSQTTTSVRTTIGADFAASFDLGGGRPLDLGFRVGWMHELADTARPITAAFAAAPGQQFTVFGATPQRDSAVIGFSAAAPLGDRASIFASYDGEIGGGTDNHAARIGFRLTW